MRPVPAWQVPGLVEVAELGAGAQGRVVLARAEDTGEVVAVKYLAAGERGQSTIGTFRAEAEMLQRVDDEHIARLLRYVESDDGAAIVMEAVEGVSLRKLLDGHQEGLAPEAALAVLKGSLLGLAAAHDVGVVHRDYKPANVIVRNDGASKLIDFGVAVLTGQGDRSGTPVYMAPEQWEGGPATPATDLYAATCVFVECVTGQRPYEGGLAELRTKHLTAPPPTEGVPEQVRPLVERGMAKDPAARQWNAREFVEELQTTADQAYGRDWEARGAVQLAAYAAALAALFPTAALAAIGSKSLAAKLLGAKAAIGSGAAAATGVVVAAALLWPQPDPIRRAWQLAGANGMVPASGIAPVDGGFALYMGRENGGFEILSVDGGSGRVRWRRPANPSYLRSVDGFQVTADRRTVYYLRPAGGTATRRVQVVAADARTGRDRWVYGREGIRLIGQPSWCERDRLCITVRDLESGTEDARVLDARTGRQLAASEPVDGRALGSELYASPDLTQLRRVDAAGKELWRRPVRQLLGIDRISLNAGWDVIPFEGGYAVELLGDEAYSGRDADFSTLDFGKAITIGIAADTGRLRWRTTGASTRCGAVSSTSEHPVRCRMRATKTFRGAGIPRLDVRDVTVEGFDLRTGKARWTWHAGPVPGLVDNESNDSNDVLRVSDTTYLVRSKAGLHMLDVGKGGRPVAGGTPIGWCRAKGFIKPAQGPADGELRGYGRSWTFPCNANGVDQDVPATTPEFAGTRSGDIFAWVQLDAVHAVRIS